MALNWTPCLPSNSKEFVPLITVVSSDTYFTRETSPSKSSRDIIVGDTLVMIFLVVKLHIVVMDVSFPREACSCVISICSIFWILRTEDMKFVWSFCCCKEIVENLHLILVDFSFKRKPWDKTIHVFTIKENLSVELEFRKGDSKDLSNFLVQHVDIEIIE